MTAPIERHPATLHMLKLFGWQHLPQDLQAVSRPLCEMAHSYVEMLDDGPELTAGLRKLLEAKDCLVRAYVLQRDGVTAGVE